MSIIVKEANLKGVKIISPPTVFEDYRGDYVEIYNRDLYREAGITTDFKQDDYATSRQHVLRGMHGDPLTEKLIKCVHGCLYVVVIQADETKPQYLQWESFTVSDSNRIQIFVPAFFALGYLVMSPTGVFHYKQSAYYHETKQFTIKWNDPRVNIQWPILTPILSMRDK